MRLCDDSGRSFSTSDKRRWGADVGSDNSQSEGLAIDATGLAVDAPVTPLLSGSRSSPLPPLQGKQDRRRGRGAGGAHIYKQSVFHSCDLQKE